MGRGGREGYRIAVVATRVPEPRFGPFVFERITEDEQFEPLDGILVRR